MMYWGRNLTGNNNGIRKADMKLMDYWRLCADKSES
jgi:hypothetical protein